jgi:hypothetical protein
MRKEVSVTARGNSVGNLKYTKEKDLSFGDLPLMEGENSSGNLPPMGGEKSISTMNSTKYNK